MRRHQVIQWLNAGRLRNPIAGVRLNEFRDGESTYGSDRRRDSPIYLEQRRMRRERGSVLVAALVALLIVMSLLGTMLLAAVQSQRQLHAERNHRQCELLLLAGMDRTAAALARDPAYAGETWLIPAGTLASGEARVAIRVIEAAAGHQKQVEITAEYPLGDEWSIRRSFAGTYSTSTSSLQEN